MQKSQNIEYFYLDLFEDGFYANDTTSHENQEKFDNLKDHIRLLLMVNLIHGRVALVPEQWATSSAAAIQVLGEVAGGFLKARAAIGKNVTPPFYIHTYNRSPIIKTAKGDIEIPKVKVRNSPPKWFRAALWERSITQDRFRLHPKLLGKDSHERQEFSEIMAEIAVDGIPLKDIEVNLSMLSDGTYAGANLAKNLANLITYTSDYYCKKSGDFNLYNADVRMNAERIMRNFHELRASKVDVPEQYFRLFNHVLKHDLSKTGRLMDVFKEIEAQEPDLAEPIGTVIRLYRGEMHKTLARHAGANGVKATMSAYDNTKYDASTYDLVRNSLEANSTNWEGGDDIFGLMAPQTGLRIAPGKKIERAHMIDWESFWYELFRKLVGDRADQLAQELNHHRKVFLLETDNREKIGLDLLNLMLEGCPYMVPKSDALAIDYERIENALRFGKKLVGPVEDIIDAANIKAPVGEVKLLFQFPLEIYKRTTHSPLGLVRKLNRKTQ